MLFWSAVVCTALILSGLFLEAFLTNRALRKLRASFAVAPHPARELPPAVILLAVRGRDPMLRGCLQSLLAQEHPHYQLIVILDPEADQSQELIQQFQESAPPGRLRVITLQQRRKHCGGKVNALLEALPHLPPAAAHLAIADADILPEATWLRELVAPLLDPHIGYVTGNRWFEPQPGSLGAILRSAWNFGAWQQMGVAEIPWGGSLAFRVSTISEWGIAALWERSFTEDVPLYAMARRAGQVGLRVPHLLLVNRESCRLRDIPHWTRRQLFFAWLYHPRWWVPIGIGLYFSGLMAGLAALLVMAAARGDLVSVSLLLATPVVLLGGLATQGWQIEQTVARHLRNRGIPLHTLGPWLVPGTTAAAILHCMNCWAVMFCRRIRWRGITYRIRSPWEIEIEHVRNVPTTSAADESVLQ